MVGVLARTGTPVDQTVHVPLSAIDALGRLGGPAAAHALGKIVLEGRDGGDAVVDRGGRGRGVLFEVPMKRVQGA